LPLNTSQRLKTLAFSFHVQAILPLPLLTECGTNLKIRFAADSRISSVQQSVFSEISKKKKNEQYKKRIVRFSLQFLKLKRLLSRLHF
ncbi:hypothetical protein, partial [Enterococcus durans]|uniref:hypothetical protein n=1 Tax=Enterococcus durans TaxID=53345 RepID=UPI0019655BEC